MPHHEPNRALARQKLEALAWAGTPESRRGGSGGRRQVLLDTTDGTGMVPLSELTDYQLRRYIGPGRLEEAGDMAKNGEGQTPELAFIEEVKSRLDIGDRKIRFSVGGGTPGTPYYTGQLFIQFYNVPAGIGGASAENNRLGFQVTGFKGDRAVDKIKVEQSVRGPSFGDARFKLRAKSAAPENVAEYIADFVNMAAKKAPYGHEFDNYEKNSSLEDLSFDLREYGANMQHWHSSGGDPIYAVGSYADSGKVYPKPEVIEEALSELEGMLRKPHSSWKAADKRELRLLIEQTQELCSVASAQAPNASHREEPDETAARELSLYIENEYSLVGAPNSQGKSIEKNLLRKLKNGSFNLELSEQAWMHLIESGAKKYCAGDSGSGAWNKIFNKPTRELVAHEFATTFYEEYKLGNKGP